MKKLCPQCHTEMIKRSQVYVCPRHDIGDCVYDAFDLTDDNDLQEPMNSSDLRCYTVADNK